MSTMITSGRRQAALALAAVAGLVCALLGIAGLSGQAPAAAAPEGVTMTFTCKFPFLPDQDVKVRIATNMPKVAVVGKPTVPRLTIETVSAVNNKTTQGLRALDAATLAGTAQARAVVEIPEQPGGLGVTASAAIKHTRIPPAGSFDIAADAWSPGLTFKEAGPGRIRLRDLLLFPLLKKADGSLTDLGDDLQVPCDRKSGSDVVAEFTILEKDEEPPAKPGNPTVTDQTGRTISLKWSRSDDNTGISGYAIYSGDTKLADTYGGETSTTVTGLTPNTAYNLRVKARDYGFNLSEASEPVSARTGPDTPEQVPPTAPGQPSVTDAGGSWVRMEWGESTDNLGVTAYEIFQDGNLAATFPATEPDGWVEGLAPLHSYTFTIRAKDAAGNVSAFSPPVTARTKKGTPTGCGIYPNAPKKLASRGCIYMAGYTNVTKLKGAAVLNDPQRSPQFANVAYRTVEKKEIDARFRFSRPLSTRASFLTFDFMPTTATIEMKQVGEGTMHGTYDADAGGYNLTTTMKVSVRVHSATVNGAPLKLGNYCQTGKPMELKLKAKPADFKDILEGGLLTANSRIPSFSGCGHSEDIDRLFIGAISGATNYMKINLGPICKSETAECIPVVPKR